MSLIIVESPTKARTFNRLLNKKKYFVFATLGHFRDLPKNKISINYENNFEPTYKIISKKNSIVKKLKELYEKNDEIIIPSDPDREGESIGYHVAYTLGFIKEKWPEISIIKAKNKTLKRIVFHEITYNALNNALKNTEDLRLDLIKSQQARRILDRIVGYELSPILWKKTKKYWLSAGRVQTVVLRLIVEREKEINNFKTKDYFQILGDFSNTVSLQAKLNKIENRNVEIKNKLKLFAGDYEYSSTFLTENNINKYTDDIKNDKFTISNIKEDVLIKYPPPPFITSTLQQDAYYKFRFSSKMTMRLAQNLYEKGLITYHRTDSFNLSSKFVFTAKDYIEKIYGKEYSLEKPRGFRMKSKLSQEAHEAIRPTKLENDLNSETIKSLNNDQKKVYEIIYNRALSTQMKEARLKMIKIDILGQKNYLFISESQKFIFDGFLKLLNPAYVKKYQQDIKVKKGEELKLIKLNTEKKQTTPPPRYSEGSLIRIMEDRGVGRPSTYAPIISLIQTRGYVGKESGFFVPSPLGTGISDYLSKSFANIFEIDFTAQMENELDDIANNQKDLISTLNIFYLPFKRELDKEKVDNSLIKIKEISQGTCPKCNKPLNVRFSKFGKFLACSGYPECKFTKPFTYYVKNKNCPKFSGKIVIKYSKKKVRFFACDNYPKCKFTEFNYKKL